MKHRKTLQKMLKARVRVARTNLHAAYARLEVASRRKKSRAHDLDTPLIVSLASYPDRFDTLSFTLKSLLRQTIQADATILWVDKEHQEQLPPEVLALQSKGLTISAGENLRSYNKIIPVLRAFPESTIVTADDDVHYPSNWLEQLVAERTANAAAKVICHRGHKIILGEDRFPLPYKQWHLAIRGPEQSPLIFPTGVLGVLYAPDAFHPEVTRSDLFSELSPMADDIWLYWMFRLQGRSARKTASEIQIIEWPGSQVTSLRRGNVLAGRNDTSISAMISRYGFPEFDRN